MALITEAIPQQNFEKILDRLGSVLTVEFAGQFTLTSDADLKVNIYNERIIPFEPEELPAINICLARGDYENKTIRDVNGRYLYHIYVVTSAENTDDASGDQLAKVKLNKIVGVIRAILANRVYVTLGFAQPSIQHHSTLNFDVLQPPYERDTDHITTGVLEHVVRIEEKTQLEDGTPWAESNTTVTLIDTEKGFKYELSQP